MRFRGVGYEEDGDGGEQYEREASSEMEGMALRSSELVAVGHSIAQKISSVVRDEKMEIAYKGEQMTFHVQQRSQDDGFEVSPSSDLC